MGLNKSKVKNNELKLKKNEIFLIEGMLFKRKIKKS
jgi:hypothetical protein